jgi:multidrug efflux pump subunit AcrB
MSMSAYWTVRARLLAVPGVAGVALWGERLQMMQVQVDPPKMAAHDVALDEVMERRPPTPSTPGCCGSPPDR